ncbi:MAG: type I restriction-modification system endonuclease [Mesorhizobium sp.]|uniref:type I restriction-modification system endonuclease n=2 Tax=Mesorhizobium sp. TaxID=1871066 RepID=UPI000FE7B8D9|nr:type I restriction-modification system endonuclease [Mesorhizobium sp.]RWI18628.1 MAG: type I restriction-modification system endonuclease [Mesorhizobium sp.]RWK93394.1 MAG: type I restriction-modification system endonuclease [Mesorhizobium sp.]
MKAESLNFEFLAAHDKQLVRLSALAERYFRDDPNTCLIKLRQFGEVLAQLTAAKSGLFASVTEPQSDLLRRLKFERIVPQEPADLFHQLRISGNRATHSHAGDHAEALTALKIARQLGIWFHRTFASPGFSPGQFVPPPDPVAGTEILREELDRLRKALDETRSEAEKARLAAEESAKAHLSAEERARVEREERAVWEQLAVDAEQANSRLTSDLRALQEKATASPTDTVEVVAEAAERAARRLEIDEAATRTLIDQQMRDRGWEADSQVLRYAAGARPAQGKAMAIAEWPTESGPADYVLFDGMCCVGVVEAKRQRKNVSAAIDQAERYSKGILIADSALAPGAPWGPYRVPFVFSTNGRPYLKQIETESGIWFRDSRYDANHRRALNDWFTPDGLTAELQIDRKAAQASLAAQPFNFGFPLRPYQRDAIEKVEEALGADRRAMLVAMATGTGKTKLSIAMLYRLLSAKRFRRVCFVVDRNALGTQAEGEFTATKIIGPKAFGDIFDIKGVEAAIPDPETKVHVCTIQGLVRRVLYSKDPSDVPPIDQYDLMVIDECHRGYLLDREMSDAELSFKGQDDYISKYRRVLEHFDAVKIGLTATPALHTVQVFGDPIYTYSYREAVIDGYLIDHEPPVQISTALAQAGIKFERGDEVEVINPLTGQIDLTHAPDEITFQVEEFNKRVVTLDFNRVVAEELARHIDPSLPGKTLIFAVSDAHADIVVAALKKALSERYGEIEDSAVRKVTGSVDRVGQLIRSYRNDSMPKIAVTVDLLTTGIDVPKITNLVFLRRVNSRILYEQMLGRATRRCDEIGKETFRIFDAVDLYPHLQGLTDMKPVVVNPSVSLETLFEELARAEEAAHQAAIRDQIVVKMRRRIKKMTDDARQRYEASAGETPEATLKRLANEATAATVLWLKARSGLGLILDWDPEGGLPVALPISHHPDQVVSVTRGYGAADKPEDFLDSFSSYVRNNLNKIAALTVVVQRPRELTRAQLRELRLELDMLGFSETNLRRAWHDARNEDIAASIIGYIRQAAIGDPLVPYEDRVKEAVKRVLAKQPWTDPQRQWLKRIAEQVQREIVVDREALDQEPFRDDGGFRRLNKIFDGRLEAVLGELNDELWKGAA